MQVTPMPPISNKKTGVLRRGVFTKSRMLYVSLCGMYVLLVQMHTTCAQAKNTPKFRHFNDNYHQFGRAHIQTRI